MSSTSQIHTTLNKSKELKVDNSSLLDNDNLLTTIVDLSLEEKTRLLALNKYYSLHGHQTTSEIINKLSGMYQFSGLSLLKTYLYNICTKTKLNPLLKALIVKGLCSYNKKDETGYKALDIIYPSMGLEVPTPIKVELITLLMKCKKYHKNSKIYFCSITNDPSIEVDYRYKTILSLEHLIENKKTRLHFITEACWEFSQNSNNPTRYRILSCQYLLQKSHLKNTRKKKIQDLLLQFASDGELDYNVRADAADVLLQLGTDNYKNSGRDIILLLGLSLIHI